MNEIRYLIRKIIAENKMSAILDSSIDDIQSIIDNANTQSFGYNVLRAVREEDSTADIVFTIILQHSKPDFGKYIDQLKGKSRYSIYFDTPRSKTTLTRWLTGFKQGADIDMRQKSAAIKVAQIAGLDCIQRSIIDKIEAKYDCTCVANFTGAKTQKKGQSIFELFIFDSGTGEIVEPIETPKQPTSIPVDGEDVHVPEKPAPKPVKKPAKKATRKSKRKKLKLTRDQKKAGYTTVNQQGHARHVLPEEELTHIADHAANLIFKGGALLDDELGPQKAHDLYLQCKNNSLNRNASQSTQTFRVVDDYYNEQLPI